MVRSVVHLVLPTILEWYLEQCEWAGHGQDGQGYGCVTACTGGVRGGGRGGGSVDAVIIQLLD